MDAWFGNLWRKSHKGHVLGPEKAVIGILAFEVATLMSKVVNLWERLSDKQIIQLREEIIHSPGIQKLVSDDGDYLMDLVLAEIIDNLGSVTESVARLGKRCADPLYHHLDNIVGYFVEMDLNWCGWEYRLKKMDRKIKKMERFSAVTAQLYQELEVLEDLDQSLRRMHSSVGSSKVKLLEFQQKVMRQRQEVRNLREMSPWIRTYDYTVRLLLRSVFTILERIKHVFGVNQVQGSNNSESITNDSLVRSHSMSALMRPSVHPSENNRSRLYSGPLGRSVSNLGSSTLKKRSMDNKLQKRYQSSILCGKPPQMKTRRFAHVGGCMMSGSDSPVMQSCIPANNFSLKSSGAFKKDVDNISDTDTDCLSCGNVFHSKSSPFNSKQKLLTAPIATIGAAALPLHYANVIILIEKLASCPHLISLDARDDLYNMLPASIRTSLSAKLKLFTKTLASSIYDATLAAEWNFALARTLKWLAPLAHNMIRWRSERNFEKQRIVSGTTVFLVQTLYFANQEKTEAAIIELLMGLNYISRFGREFNDRAFRGSSCSIASDDYLAHKDNFSYYAEDNSS